MRITLITAVLLVGCHPSESVAPVRQSEETAVAVGDQAEQPDDRVGGAVGPSLEDNLALAVEGEGLRLFDPDTGSARALAFGTSRDDLLAALAFRGPAGTGTNGECGAGPLDYAAWADGLTLYFQNGVFGGWALDGRAGGALTTPAGVGPGTTRAELEAAYDVSVVQSTLGVEFTAGALAGILDGEAADATISNLWAGVSCNFR